MTTREAPTADDTRALGAALARVLRAGDVVLLSGPLGAGKTTFAQGVAEGLEVRGTLTSPTFVIARSHPSVGGGPGVVHVDLYRLGGWAELEDLDLEATLDEAVTLVEWGEGLAEGLARDRLEVVIQRHDDDRRTVEVSGVGERWSGVDLDAVLTG